MFHFYAVQKPVRRLLSLSLTLALWTSSLNLPMAAATRVAPPAHIDKSLRSNHQPNRTASAPATPATSTVQFSQSGYTVNEGDGFATITVNRTGDLSAPATVKYATSDATDVNFHCDPSTPGQSLGIASRKCDYHIAVGRLRFAAGESTKQIAVSIVDDVYVEGPETFNISLSDPTGTTLGSITTAAVTIIDNDTAATTANPIDGTSFYVRQLYVDLLSREPDPAGWAGWIHRIDFCGQPGEALPPCDRVTVGGDGFLRSAEFFDRQFFVLRLYRTGFGRIPIYDEVGDLAYVSGFLSSSDLELNKQELVADIMSRTEFSNKYSGLSNLSFVDMLLQTVSVSVPQAVHDTWVANLNGNMETRAQVYREISERQEVSNKYLHEAQVISAYYGFFTRNPDGAYFNFLQRLDSGEINLGDLANAFINASEYRLRFASPNSNIHALTVDAGASQTINLPSTLALSGQVNDNGLPQGSTLNTSWTKVSGPGSVVFSNASGATTSATFNATTITIFNTPGTYVLRLTASDGQLTNSSTVTITVNPDTTPTPPDPATVAPPLDMTETTTIDRATQFLYTGPNPIQQGVTPGTIKPHRAAVVRGRVLDKNNQPVSNVAITILNHTEFGSTRSRADGMFDMVVNGGGLLTINYAKTGFLTAQRQMNVPWQDYAMVPDVVLLPFDDQVAAIDLNASTPVQVAQGTTMSDSSGSRHTALMFKQGTTATMTLPNGTTQSLPLLHVRATEFTVGPNGPAAMPGTLPATSFYTYSSDYSIDEAVAANATSVAFSQPIVQYNENFLHFAVGTVIPSGSYNKTSGLWIPSDNGLVIKILSVNSSVANLDIDGSGNAASDSALTALGINMAERQQLATLYTAGQSLWRVPLSHFSAWDSNWGFVPPSDAQPPKLPPPTTSKDCDCQHKKGDPNIGVERQELEKSVNITGTPFSLHYDSDRQVGHNVATIPLSGGSLPASLKRIDLTVQVAGSTILSQSFPATTNQETSFAWDGKDVYGRTVQGAQPATFSVGYVYDGVYEQVSRFGYNGNGTLVDGDRTRKEITLPQLTSLPLGHFDAKPLGLGGWNLSVHHFYDFGASTLYLGDGTRRTVALQPQAANLASGNAVISTLINGFASGQTINPVDAAMGPDGSLFVNDANHFIRKIDRSGNITTVAGTGDSQFSGDGGLATQAGITATDITVGKDGSIYFYNGGHARIRKIDPAGIITSIAGNNGQGSSGDGGPALQAQIGPVQTRPRIADDGSLYFIDRAANTVRKIGTDGIITTVASTGTCAGCAGISDIALGADGSLYILDAQLRKVTRVTPDGTVKTVAGGGSAGSGNADGISATSADLQLANDSVEVAPDGTIYLTETGGTPGRASIRRVTPDGILSTIAGNGVPGFSGDGGFAAAAQVSDLTRNLNLGPDGNLYFVDLNNRALRRVAAPLPKYTGSDFLIPSEDGSEVYHFDSNGRHLSTTNALTGATIYTFTYNAARLLTQVTDGDGNVTTIERDGSGNPMGIVSPYNQRTSLTVDANGYLSRITDPASQSYQFSSTSLGLMTGVTDPRGNSQSFDYDSLGKLIKTTDPNTAVQTLARTDNGQNYSVAFSDALNRTSNYDVVHLSADALSQIETDPSGLQTFFIQLKNGNNTLLTSDGMIETEILGPDPRFGITAPISTSDTTSTPGGLILNVGSTRAVTLSNANDSLSLATQTDTLSINGLNYTSVFTAANKSFALTTPTGRQGTSTIDAQGRPTQAQFGGLNASAYTYDSRGRLSTETFGAGAVARTYNLSYDSAGFLSSYTDPLGRTESYTRDAIGRITQQTLRDGRVIAYSYDANGNLTSITPPGRSAHTFTFTTVNLAASYTAPNIGGSSQTTYAYNLARQLTSVTRPDSQTISFGYDNAGRLNKLTIPGGQYSYAYSATTGNLTGITAPGGGTLAFAYDGSLPTGTTWAGTVAGSVTHAFDNFFRVSSQSINGANTVNFAYDDDSLLKGAGDLALTRNAQNGLVTGTTLGNVTDTIAYNGFAEPTSYTAAFNSTQLLNEQYTRDKLGRITQKVESVGGTTNTYAYTYDQAGRLTNVTLNGGPNPLVTYTYDSNSNRLSSNVGGVIVNATYDAQDRLTQYGNTTYSYTANGELQSKTASGQTTAYSYDVTGNLTHVTLPNATQLDYVIDGQQRRIGRKVNGTLVQGFLYQNQLAPVAELDGSNNVVSRFVYGSRRNVPDYMIKGGTTYRIITDQLGSPRLVIDVNTGMVAQRVDYDEFGVVLTDTNPGFQPFGFAGGLYDKDTGLTRFGARDYDAQVGRWTAKDPILFAGGDTNLYGYVLDDPVNFGDAKGLSRYDSNDPFANEMSGGSDPGGVTIRAPDNGPIQPLLDALGEIGVGTADIIFKIKHPDCPWRRKRLYPGDKIYPIPDRFLNLGGRGVGGGGGGPGN